MITIAECKLQCNLDETEIEFDRWFAQTIPAVVESSQAFLDRKIYVDQAALDADESAPETAVLFNASIKMAMLMLIGHWFVNRESSSALNLNDVPMGFEHLLTPYRYMVGVA